MPLSLRARVLLEALNHPDQDNILAWQCARDYTDDGEWFRLSHMINIGRVTIAELLAAGLIERREYSRYSSGEYRLCRDEDFGDLWVE